MKPLLAMRFRGGASVSERGPSARRGMQFAEAPLKELVDHLARVRNTLRQLDAVRTRGASGDRELTRLASMNGSELETLRRKNVALQSDLRAELRRRGAY